MYLTTPETRSEAMTTWMIGTHQAWLAAAARAAADRLGLAAAPTYGLMALLSGVLGASPQDLLCAASHDAMPLSGMVAMYLLMAAFNSAPWLRLLASWQSVA
jgi:hypothetical protein